MSTIVGSTEVEMQENPANITIKEVETKEEPVETVSYHGLQTYNTEADFEEPANIPADHFGHCKTNKKVGMCEVKIGSCTKEQGKKCPLCRQVIFNPVTTLFGFGVLLGFALWCIMDPIKSKNQLGVWQAWCTKMFTWFYISSQNVWIMFLGETRVCSFCLCLQRLKPLFCLSHSHLWTRNELRFHALMQNPYFT